MSSRGCAGRFLEALTLILTLINTWTRSTKTNFQVTDTIRINQKSELWMSGSSRDQYLEPGWISTYLMVFHFIHRLDCLWKEISNVACNNTVKPSQSTFSSASTSFPTFSQASDTVFWNLTVDFMPSRINATLSWLLLLLLLCAGLEAGLFKKKYHYKAESPALVG